MIERRSLQHAAVGIVWECLRRHLLDRGKRGIGIACVQACRDGSRRRPDRRPAGDASWREIVVHDIFAAEAARAIEQPARIGPRAAGRREHLPERQRVAIAAQVVEQRGKLATVVGAGVGRERGQAPRRQTSTPDRICPEQGGDLRAASGCVTAGKGPSGIEAEQRVGLMDSARASPALRPRHATANGKSPAGIDSGCEIARISSSLASCKSPGSSRSRSVTAR